MYLQSSRRGVERWQRTTVQSLSPQLVARLWRPLSERILTHLKMNNLLSKRQFGFLGGRSTILQLLTFLDKCVDALSRGNVTDAVYIDFQKAFDTVPHKRLMVKLQAYGISGVIQIWINAFLNGQTQRVIVNGIAPRK